MGQNIKLAVFDIDGTINGNNNQVNEPVRKAIKAAQDRGVRIAIATGRMYRSALRFHEAVNADLPIISYQGAYIKDPRTQELVGHWPVDLEYALSLIDDFADLVNRDRLSVQVYLDDNLYVKKMSPQTAAYEVRSGVDAVIVGDLKEFLQAKANDANSTLPTKVLALSDDPELTTELLRTLKQRYTPGQLYLTKSVATFFEATNPIANKGTAVKHLAENILGFSADEVMAVGDNFNDLEMIEYAGVGVAMGNAPEGLQEVADWVAPDVDEDGVAAAIAEFIL
jgi:Cof subfamily protein (haloacid dehalogenase superfamily)